MLQQNIADVINNSNLLVGEKKFLLEKVKSMNPLDILKLKNQILAKIVPTALESLHKMQQDLDKKFDKSDIITQLFTPKTKIPASTSILQNNDYLGTAIASFPQNSESLEDLQDFVSLSQLGSLLPEHFASLDSSSQILKNFLDKLDLLIENIENVNIRRGYYMIFLQSKLFDAYISTGLTALRHPEYTPAEAILNLLHQLETDKYIDNRQFQAVAILSSHFRSLCHF
jgi:hypothetical protein